MVTISKDFYIQTTCVTQGQWKALMGMSIEEQRNKSNPTWELKGRGPDYPIYYISWFEAQIFVNELNRRLNEYYRLPTESEWEYACRAGSSSPFCFGHDTRLLEQYAWYCDNSNQSTQPVAQKLPNAWGLYDMHGNVMEWCQDVYEEYPQLPSINPVGPNEGVFRVIRGGGWTFNPDTCRSAFRYCVLPPHRANVLGIRLVKEV